MGSRRLVLSEDRRRLRPHQRHRYRSFLHRYCPLSRQRRRCLSLLHRRCLSNRRDRRRRHHFPSCRHVHRCLSRRCLGRRCPGYPDRRYLGSRLPNRRSRPRSPVAHRSPRRNLRTQDGPVVPCRCRRRRAQESPGVGSLKTIVGVTYLSDLRRRPRGSQGIRESSASPGPHKGTSAPMSPGVAPGLLRELPAARNRVPRRVDDVHLR